MRALLDTHAFLWWVVDDARLSPVARAAMEDGRNVMLFSAASAYEIALKSALGRLTLPESPDAYVPSRLAALGLSPMPVDLVHALRAGTLPAIHRDPWDRLLVAQAQIEDIPIVTADEVIRQYDVDVIW